MTKTSNAQSNALGTKQGALFVIFCIWTFVLLCRPQDIFPFLAPIRPVLITTILTLFLFLLRYHTLLDLESLEEPQVKLYTVLIAIMIIGIPFSLYRRGSFMMVFTVYVNVILFFYIFFRLVDSIQRVYTVILMGCIGNGIYSAFSLLWGDYQAGRLSFGGMFDPNDLCFFAISFLPLNFLFILHDHRLWVRLTCIGSVGFNILLILLTGSRGGLLALGMVSFMLLFTRMIKMSYKIAFITACLIFLYFAPINYERYETLLNVKQDYNVYDETGRIAIWTIGMRNMLANPLTGVGVGCFPESVGRDRVRRGAESLRWQTAHNSVVQIGTETGILGMALFLLMSLNVFRIFYRVRKGTYSDKLIRVAEVGRVGFLGLFAAGFFLSQAYSFYWAFYIVLSATVNQLSSKEMGYLSA